MPLVEKVTVKKIPGPEGGWYWYKSQNGVWEPVCVKPATNTGWPATICLCAHDTNVAEVPGEWGPQIFPPE